MMIPRTEHHGKADVEGTVVYDVVVPFTQDLVTCPPVFFHVLYTGKNEDLATTFPDFTVVRGSAILVKGKVDMDFTGIHVSEIV